MPGTNSDASPESPLPPDLDIRTCRKCSGDMICGSRRTGFLDISSHFICQDCGHKAALSAGGASGVYLAVAMLAAGILSFIFWGSRGGYDLAGVVKTLALFTVFSTPAWMASLQTRRYPVSGRRAATAEETADLTGEAAADPFQKGIRSLDRLGPKKAFGGVLLAVVLFLGAAALIGWVNFTFFGDRLFG